MSELKYYDGVRRAQSAQRPVSELPNFDLERLRSGRLGKLFGKVFLEDPRWWLAILRRHWPMLKLGRFLLVTRNADVRDILERQEEFETPYGPEMTEIARGANFILGMQDGPAYRRMKSSVLSAFPVDEVEDIVRPLAARHAQQIMLKAAPGFDAVRDLLKIVPVRICRDYFGMVIDEETEFANRSIALSNLFFADPFASPAAREVAVVAADWMIKTIDRSIAAARNGTTSAETPLARLVEMHESEPSRISLGEIRSVMMGMIAGFAPTNLLASGNCLDVILSRPEARSAVEDAMRTSDNGRLDKAILEAMRFKPIWIGPFRYTARDAVIAEGSSRERMVKKGTIVMPSTLSAMFDAQAVRNPNEFNSDRSHRDYLVFGHGIHLCIGAAIAHVQIAETFRALFSKEGVRRARGKAGRLSRMGTYPDSMHIDFEPDPLCRTTDHAMVTVVSSIKPSISLDDLRTKVDALGNPASPKIAAALDRSGVIHFASLAVAGKADPATERDGEEAHLVLELSGDGSEAEVIKAFVESAGPLLREIYGAACDMGSGESLQDFLRRNAMEISPYFGSAAGLVFSGTPGHSIRRIKAEAALADVAWRMVASLGTKHGLSANAVLDKVRRRLAAEESTRWALAPTESLLENPAANAWQAIKTTLGAPVMLFSVTATLLVFWWATYQFVFDPISGSWRNPFLAVASLVLTVFGMILFLAAVLGLGLVALRRLEMRDVPSDELIDLRRWEEIISREDRITQNNLTAISIVKPGILRRLALRLTFYLISIAATKVYRPGFLSNINTIHFARWVLLPKTNKLMFFSNYGGSWESYLEDFIAKASKGLTGVWSNTEGYPRTRWLFWGGACDGDSFKRWARLQQIPTLFWYSAYPKLTTTRIRIHSQIRHGIANVTTESEARDWLALFGSVPRPLIQLPDARSGSPLAARPPEILETGEIQTIFFGPLGGLEHAQMIGVRIPKDISRPKRKAWLEYVAAETTFGERFPAEKAMTVAFGPDGLARLGLDCEDGNDALKIFPLPFRQGNAPRSRILDDTGKSAPETWEWGSPDQPVDAVVVCYAIGPEVLERQLQELDKRALAAGFSIVVRLPLVIHRKGKSAVEHFGFADGLSQPVVRGTARATEAVSPKHLIAPGEFLFGYRDELGFYPPAPTVRASLDRDGHLPVPADEDAPSDGSLRDFGRNGTFLVVRQLEQHVDQFRNYCASAAKDIDDPAVTADWIAAKMVGRWRDGTSLVRNPDGRTGREADNDFSFGAEDPQGLRCPLGAHIRRSNPRDSLGQDHNTLIKIGNRHRILRVGRTYERKAGRGRKAEKGLLFMCLNTDLERQYEFIQQTWVSSTSFHGLPSEKDPTIGTQGDEGGHFSIPRWDGPIVLKKIPTFVTTRGGGYFFLPSRAAMRYLISRL